MAALCLEQTVNFSPFTYPGITAGGDVKKAVLCEVLIQGALCNLKTRTDGGMKRYCVLPKGVTAFHNIYVPPAPLLLGAPGTKKYKGEL